MHHAWEFNKCNLKASRDWIPLSRIRCTGEDYNTTDFKEIECEGVD
jgi:hypothetical protein